MDLEIYGSNGTKTATDTEVAYYPESNKYIIINNRFNEVETDFYDIEGNKEHLILKPNETRWILK